MLLRLLLSLFLVLFSSLFVHAQVDDFFKNELNHYSLWSIKNYYSRKYKTGEKILAAAERNSSHLKEINEELYCLNQLFLSRELVHYGEEKRGFNILAQMDKSPTVKHSPKLLGYLNNVKGAQQFSLQRPRKGRVYYRKAIEYLQKAKDSIGIKGNLINTANSYSATLDYDTALFYYDQAMNLQRKGITAFREALIINLAVLYNNSKQYEKAIPLLKEGMKLTNTKESDYGYATAAMDLAEAYTQLEEYDSSIHYAAISERTFHSIGMTSSIGTIKRILAYSNAGKGDFKEAFVQFRAMDSLRIVESRKQLDQLIEELNIKHQKELHDKELKIKQEKINAEKQRSKGLYMFSAVTLILLLSIGFLYFRIRNKNLFLAEKNLELTQRQAAKIEQKKKIDLKAPQELIDALETQFYIEKTFIDSELTIDKLAKKMGTNRTYLSETINHHYGKPFRTLVNHLRIQEARTLLLDKKYAHYSIEGIATSVGYRNISSFNSAFKKETGITPSFFRKQNSNN